MRLMPHFIHQREVDFADTDMGGIMHFARFVVFMETAEHEFLNALGTSVALVHDGQHVGWPRVAVSVEYRRPARFGDVLDIHVRVLRKGTKSSSSEPSSAPRAIPWRRVRRIIAPSLAERSVSS